MVWKLLLTVTICCGAGFGMLAWRSPATLLNWTVPRQHLSIIRDLRFQSDPPLALDLYRPKQATAPLPVVVFFYGGGWKDGSKDIYPFVGEALAAQGFLVVVPDYRTYPTVRFPDFLHDCATAVAWIRSHAITYGGNADRLFLMGHSAGAYNAAMLGLDHRYLRRQGVDPAQIRGFIGLAGPYDFVPEDGPTLPHIFGSAGSWAETQPVQHSQGAAPPSLLLVGGTDTTVLPRNSYRLAQRLEAAGVPVAVKTYPHLGHIGMVSALAWVFRWRATVLLDILAFLRQPRL